MPGCKSHCTCYHSIQTESFSPVLHCEKVWIDTNLHTSSYWWISLLINNCENWHMSTSAHCNTCIQRWALITTITGYVLIYYWNWTAIIIDKLESCVIPLHASHEFIWIGLSFIVRFLYHDIRIWYSDIDMLHQYIIKGEISHIWFNKAARIFLK